MSKPAGVPFTIDYRPQVGSAFYDPVDAGGVVSRLRLYAVPGLVDPPVADVGPAVKQSFALYRFSLPALAAGTYYTRVDWTPATGATPVADTNDTIVVEVLAGSLSDPFALAVLAIRAHIGSTTPPTDATLVDAYVRLANSVTAVALEVLRGRLADMLANPAKMSVDGDYSEDRSANIKGLQDQIKALVATTTAVVPPGTVPPGTVTVSVMSRGGARR